MREGWGAALLRSPQLICDMVRETKERTGLAVSTKIRLTDPKDFRATVELARQLEATGIAWLTVHGRTAKQGACVPATTEAVKLIKESLACPVIHNGDIMCEDDAARVYRETGVDGVMAARGALRNPALFAQDSPGHAAPAPDRCLARFVELSLLYGSIFPTIHHHLMFMMHGKASRADRSVFNTLGTVPAIVDFLRERDLLRDEV
jgi:tRNA-dihydrouridine synthase 4